MIRILAKNTILICIVLGISLIASCSDSFDKNQKVWISIPGSSFADESYAIGRVLKTKKKTIIIKPIKVVSASKRAIVTSLKTKVTAVPLAWVMEYKEGKERYTEIREATRKIAILNSGKSINPDKDTKRIAKIAKNYQLDELLSAVKVNRIKQKFLSNSFSTKQKIDNIEKAFASLKKVAKNNETYQIILNAKNTKLAYRQKKVVRSILLSKKPIKVKSIGKIKLRYRMFIKQSLRFIKEIEVVLQSSSQGGIEALQVIKNMSDIMDAEESYIRFISNDGERLGKIDIDLVLKYRKTQKVKAIRKDLREELKTKHEYGKLTSMQDAKNKYASIINEAKEIESDFGIKIFSKADKNNFFMKPAKLRLAQLKKDEQETYLLAMDNTLEAYHQKDLIETYLGNYPNGKHRSELKGLMSKVENRESDEEKNVERKRQLVNSKLSTKKNFLGIANYQDKKYKFKLRISQFNQSNGNFSGKIIWPNRSGAISKIRGQYDQDDLVLSFKETKVIRKGKWPGFSSFSFNIRGDKKLSGVHSYKILFLSEERPASLTL